MSRTSTRKNVYITSLLLILFIGILQLSSRRIYATNPVENGLIAFSNMSAPYVQYDIYVMNPNGSDRVNLTNTPLLDESQPDWSPDGTRIAFVRWVDDESKSDIFIMNSDGTGQINLTNSPSHDDSPRWSPDGTKIAFTSDRDDDNVDIFLMNPDGTGVVNVTNIDGNDGPAVWSTDGMRIAFNSSRTGTSEIFLMNSDGKDVEQLSNNSGDGYQTFLLDWSPSDEYLLVSRYEPGEFLFNDIYLINLDGSNPINLTNNPGLQGDAKFSPDGSLIIFNHGIPPALWTMNAADGSDKTRLSPSSEPLPFDRDPSWQSVLQSLSPIISINYSTGSIGSFFTLTGADYPANEEATVTINGHDMGKVTTDGNGAFTFILSTVEADEGIYIVTVSVNPSATIQFVLDAEAPLRPQEGEGVTLTVPAGIALTDQRQLFLPHVIR